ncbi:ECF RNA polymerase sigma factor EcfG [bacterium HR40]|nr:ECF RNA polymerase sigma factor EcfG [bacterium HR40]
MTSDRHLRPRLVDEEAEGTGNDAGADGRPPVADATVLQHIAALRRYAMLLVGDPHDADDLVQETLARVIVHLRAFRPVRDLRAYLYATMHNLFVDGHRRQRNNAHDVDVDDLVDRLVEPASQLDRLELRDLVRALQRIPAEQREVVLLVGYEGLSYSDAARILGIPIGTVMSRLSRGREALRRLTHRGTSSRLRVVK